MTTCTVCGIQMTSTFLVLTPFARAYPGKTGWGPWCDRCGYWVATQKSIHRSRKRLEKLLQKVFGTPSKQALLRIPVLRLRGPQRPNEDSPCACPQYLEGKDCDRCGSTGTSCLYVLPQVPEHQGLNLCPCCWYTLHLQAQKLVSGPYTPL